MTTLSYDRYKGHASGYDVVLLGITTGLMICNSAIGLCQLEKSNRLNQKNGREVYRWYCEAFVERDRKHYRAFCAPGFGAKLLVTSCQVIIHEGLEEIKAQLREAGIQTSSHYDLAS